MPKKILDNCTIYRLLDGMDKEKQRELCSNALKSYNQESEELSEEKNVLLHQLFDALSISDSSENIVNILQEIVLNEEGVRKNKLELLIIEKRFEYINGLISLEELQAYIHNLMLDDAYHFYQTEYRCQLVELLAFDLESDYLSQIEYIRKLKEKAIQKQLNPVCYYPK